MLSAVSWAGGRWPGSFQFLHSRDLVWSTRMQEYLLDQRSQPSDPMAWNADVTRMPARMHGEYLRRCYLHNDLAETAIRVEGRPVSLWTSASRCSSWAPRRDRCLAVALGLQALRLTETELHLHC